MRLNAAHHATKNERQQAHIEQLEQQVLDLQSVIKGKNTASARKTELIEVDQHSLIKLSSQNKALCSLIASQGEEHEAELRRDRQWLYVAIVISAAVTTLSGAVLRWLF